jgi:3,2-trans-enoyl-CoA isomerase
MMHFVLISQQDAVATMTLSRGKVNALNESVVEELHSTLANLENDQSIKAIILTGQGKFFSFGFDIPEFLNYSKEEFSRYLTKFTALYTYMFLYPKPIVAALNGHTIAGGCMLALACDYRVMVSEKAKISLNEIAFGSSVFAGSVEMLRFWVGNRNATTVLYSGKMYNPEEAKELGLVDAVITESNLISEARAAATALGNKAHPAFRSIKALLRKSLAAEMQPREKESVREFVDIWYSESTWENLNKIEIY